MIAVNLEGKVVGGNRTRPPNAAGFLIHSECHKARPDVVAICHAHTVYGKAWSTFGRPIEMLTRKWTRQTRPPYLGLLSGILPSITSTSINRLLPPSNTLPQRFVANLTPQTEDACKFYNSHSVYNSYGGVVLASEEGAQIAQALGPTNKACILRNHGLLTVGKTVDEAAFLFLSLEHACQGQLLAEAASQGGKIPKVLISDEEAEYTNRMESDSETCYAEFQAYYEWEEHLTNGDFKN